MPDNQLYLLQEAQTLVTGYLSSKLSKSIKFHTLQHTQEVVAACQLLSDYHQLADEDRFALMVAAWFHDTGYIYGEAKDHESGSINMATEFLNTHSAGEELKNKVIGCINATRIPQSPENLIEKIICDADLFHLGTDDFKEKSRLLREEIIEFGKIDLAKKDWRKTNIRFLEGHKYFTAYGKEKLEPIKDQHLAELRQKDKNTDEMKPAKTEKTEKTDKTDKKDKPKEKGKSNLLTPEAEEAKRKKEKEKEADRSIATVFRIMANNHISLSQMADSKANILISVNSIILSIIISTLFEKLQTDPNLQIPVALIVVVCVASIVFGILATRPNVSSGKFTHDDIVNKRTNLLFFGNFHNVTLDDYSWGMNEMLGDKNYMNNSMIKDNYFLGVVLAKKYRYLRIAYNVFMYGLIIAMLAFVVAFMLPDATEIYTAG